MKFWQALVCFLVACLLAGCGEPTTSFGGGNDNGTSGDPSHEPKYVTIEIVAEAGDVSLANAMVHVMIGADETVVPYNEYMDNPMSVDVADPSFLDAGAIAVEITLDGYISSQGWIAAEELVDSGDETLAFTIAVARDLEEATWTCTQTVYTNNMPSNPITETTSVSCDSSSDHFLCGIGMGDGFRLIGDKIFGDLDVSTVDGSVDTNGTSFDYEERAKINPNNYVTYHCER